MENRERALTYERSGASQARSSDDLRQPALDLRPVAALPPETLGVPAADRLGDQLVDQGGTGNQHVLGSRPDVLVAAHDLALGPRVLASRAC